jgi:signal transduction histidine kinase
MMIRNANRPEGLLVSVDGRPLDPSAGQHGAVAVFHDITELRRYEADLSVFAGVVAHDLKAPLAVIRGHCETAGDALDLGGDADSVAEARQALARIAIAVDRMAALIDTLLAYTTSRDAPLRLTTVALDPLVAEVVADRTSPLRPGDGPPPDIYVGPLPTVHADPAMLRHVIDNLIGNALKYVQPGRGARIDVTAAVRSPGWVGVEIADRGIGIPEDDKPNIFESFHRAQSAAGYAGTGLGLAICRRIVERHGGTIGVTDNPGGGTRFTFTLPAARSLMELPAVPASPAAPTPASGEPAGSSVVRAGHPTAGASAAERPTDVTGALSRALAERSDAEQASVASPAVATKDPRTVRVRSAVPGGRPGRPQARSTRKDA